MTPYVLHLLLGVALLRGDHARARIAGEECLALMRANGDHFALQAGLLELLRLARHQQDLAEVEARGREALAELRQAMPDLGLGANRYAASLLETMAWPVQARGHAERAAAVLGAASALRDAGGSSRDVLDQSIYEQTLAMVRAAAGDRFTAGWERGRGLSLDAAIAEALPPAEPADEHTASTVASAPVVGPPGGGLSERELEVLRLLAAGRSNPEIAEALVISVHTVVRHANHIFAKLGMSNRVEAAAYAHRHGLA